MGRGQSTKLGGRFMQRVNSFRHHRVLTLSKQPVVPMTADKDVADHALRYLVLIVLPLERTAIHNGVYYA